MKLILIFMLTLPAMAFAARYRVDTDHSRIGFSVTHMMISQVNGKFNDYIGTFDFDPKTGVMKDTSFVVKTASVDTEVEKRDKHLRSADFFDVEKYPEMTLTNSKLKKLATISINGLVI